MLIIGAGGFAGEVLNILLQNGIMKIAFFDNVNQSGTNEYFGYRILKNEEDVKSWFVEVGSRSFCLGVGGTKSRRKLSELITSWGGEICSITSRNVDLGLIGNEIGIGSTLCSGVIITSNVKIGMGCLLNLKVSIGHDCILSDFVEISPGVSISGGCEIGSGVSVGTNVSIIPNVRIGENSIIGAGAVVTKDVPPNVMVAGVPAVIKKTLGNV